MHFLRPITWELLKSPYLTGVALIKVTSHALCTTLTGQSTSVNTFHLLPGRDVHSQVWDWELSTPSKGRGIWGVELTLQP